MKASFAFGLISYISVIVCFIPFVDASCDNGESNQTVPTACSEILLVTKKIEKTVKIQPHCSWWIRVFFWSDKCQTKYRIEDDVIKVNKTVPSQCQSVVCCPGFTFSNGTCEIGCTEGLYGENCTENCTCPENAYTHCERDTGNCTCKAGSRGINCTEPCQEGYFGNGCHYACSCQNNATCDKETGYCNCTEPGWEGTFCDQRCNFTFGLNCREKCTCNENETCNPLNGMCTCKPGKKGENCSMECDNWRFGVECAHNCNCNENTTAFCDKTNGACKCKSGYIGQECNDTCPFGHYGDDCSSACSCVGTPHCDHENGTCICLGKHGVNCTQDCDFQRYGPDCENTCNCTGDKQNGSCDAERGVCHCISGWQGEDCSKHQNQQVNANTQDYTGNEDGKMTTSFAAASVAGGCGLVIIILVIAVVVIQRKRKQKSFERSDVKSHGSATYDGTKSSQTIITNETRKQSKDELKSSNTETQKYIVKSTNAYTDTDIKNAAISDSENPVSSKDKLSIENSANLLEIDTQKQCVVYECGENTNSKNSLLDNKDDDNDHYSDVESGDVLNDQDYSDEEQYDSLENNMQTSIKKIGHLPNYSSFEQVRQESSDRDQETMEEPYDEIESTMKRKKTPMVRNDYDTFDKINYTIDGDFSDFAYNNLNKTVNDKETAKLELPLKSNSSLEIAGEDSCYNFLDHTGKSFYMSNAHSNVYHKNELSKPNSSKSIVSTHKTTDAPHMAESDSEDSEYNSLDYTGKSFCVTSIENYHTTKLQPETNSGKNMHSADEQNTKNNSEVACSETTSTESDTNIKTLNDNDYNSLDHSGKSFHASNTPENIYHTKDLLAKTCSNKSNLSVDKNENILDTEENSHYEIVDENAEDDLNLQGEDGLCHYEDAEDKNQTGEANDEQSLYEVPDISTSGPGNQESHEGFGTNTPKVKPKSKQRHIDDYEQFNVLF